MNKGIILIGVLTFIILGCQRKIALKEVKSAHYVHEFVELKPKNFLVSFFVSFDTLSKWINQIPNKIIFESKSNQSMIGFPLQASLAGHVKISSSYATNLTLQVPAFLEAKPNIAGFNAGTVQGKLQMNLGVDLQVRTLNKFSFGDIKYSYQWLEKPMIRVAGFGINAGPVIDNLLKAKSEEITATIKSNFEELFHPSSLEKMLVENSKTWVWPTYILPINDVGVGIKNIEFQSLGLHCDLLVNTSIGISLLPDQIKKPIRYYTNLNQKEGRDLAFGVNLDWVSINNHLMKLAKVKFKNERIKISIHGNDIQYLTAKIVGFKGSESEISINFVPVIFENQRIGIRIINQELIGLSFPSSLFKKRAYHRINRIASELNFDVVSIGDVLLKASGGPLKINHANFSIESMEWNESSFHVSGLLRADYKFSK
jgi:hypothetical protein